MQNWAGIDVGLIQNHANWRGGAEKALYDGFAAARRRVVGLGVLGRTKWSSPRFNSSHWTVSPPRQTNGCRQGQGKANIESGLLSLGAHLLNFQRIGRLHFV